MNLTTRSATTCPELLSRRTHISCYPFARLYSYIFGTFQVRTKSVEDSLPFVPLQFSDFNFHFFYLFTGKKGRQSTSGRQHRPLPPWERARVRAVLSIHKIPPPPNPLPEGGDDVADAPVGCADTITRSFLPNDFCPKRQDF